MLITLIMGLNMTGGVVPPIPIQVFPGGAEKSVMESQRAEFEKRIQIEDEEIIILMVNLLKWR